MLKNYIETKVYRTLSLTITKYFRVFSLVQDCTREINVPESQNVPRPSDALNIFSSHSFALSLLFKAVYCNLIH